MTLFAVARLPREILFGSGQRSVIGRVAARYGSRALVCTDQRFAATATFAEILASLESASLTVDVFDDVEPDVPYDAVGPFVDRVRSFGADLVIGIGGGSCLDMAKCAALLLRHGGTLRDYYGEFKVPGPTLPVIALPTTAGTGSEVTPVAVVSDSSRTLKVGISSPHLVPVVAICDPDLTSTCPPSLTAIAGADALTHAIEAFTAVRRTPHADLAQDHVFVGKNDLSDHFALQAIGLLGGHLGRACADGGDAVARASVMMGALLAGCAFGTAGTAAAHAIQYPVGALTGTPHGLGVATLLPYVMTYNRPAATAEFAAIADALGVGTAGWAPEAKADAAIAEVARLFAGIGIAPTLEALGLERDRLDWTAEQAIGIDRLIKNNPRPLDASAMKRLVRAAYEGDLAAAA
ncbi:iron-containing alcohol dehydrogenase [Amorphus sp. MBR-141]